MAKPRKEVKFVEGKIVKLGELIKYLQGSWGRVHKEFVNFANTPSSTRVKLVAVNPESARKLNPRAIAGWSCRVQNHKILSLNNLKKKVIYFLHVESGEVDVRHWDEPKTPQVLQLHARTTRSKKSQKEGRIHPSLRVNLHATPQHASDGTRHVSVSPQIFPDVNYLEE